MTSNTFSSCFAVIDVYQKDSTGFLPIFRLDTTLISYKRLYKFSDELSVAPFLICLQKFSEGTLSKKGVKALNWNEVEQYYSKRLAYPFFSDEYKPLKGVFLSYQDLLNNKIS